MIAAFVTALVGLAALFLVASGYSKVWRPLPTARALYAADLPSGFRLVRLLGGLEVVVGSAALFLPSDARIAFAAAAVLYAAFGGFLAWALAAGKTLKSCGCLGGTDVPPSWTHAGANLVLALALAIASVGGYGRTA